MNKKIKRAEKAVITSILICGLIFSNSFFTTNKKVDAKKVEKQESVYVYAESNGNKKSITVADWLKNSGDNSGIIKDTSVLTDLKNTKGDEKFKQENKSLDWDTSGNDIYYQGKTDKDLPVSIRITYKLDGKEVDPKDILGKSGKFEMNVKYNNYSKVKKTVDGEEIEIYTPFLMVTGTIMESDIFSNVKIDNGKVINDGSNNIVIGFGIPNFVDSLKLKDKDLKKDLKDKLTNEFTITANVKNFELGNTFTYASSNIFNNINLDKVDKLEELEDALEDLTNGSDKLVDGSNELYEGLNKYSDGVKKIENAIKKYSRSGIKTLINGIKKVAKGSKKLNKGLKKYTKGVKTYAGGVNSYLDGSKKVSDGINLLYKSVYNLPESYKAFNTGLRQYTQGLDTIASKENVKGLKTGASTIEKSIGTISSSLADLEKSYDNNEKVLAALKQFKDALTQLDQITEAQGGQSQNLAAKYEQVLTNLDTITNSQKEGVKKIKEATSKESELGKGAKKLSTSVAKVMDGAYALSQKSSQLRNASTTINNGLPSLVSGVTTLKTGGKELVSNNNKIKKASKTLINSGKTLNKGMNDLNNGLQTLNKGGKKVYNATIQLVNGVSQLDTATGKIESGARSLAKGVKTFDKEGIQKINDKYNDNLKPVINRLKAILDAGKEYNNFSGISDDMDGEVKFIIETESIKKDDK